MFDPAPRRQRVWLARCVVSGSRSHLDRTQGFKGFVDSLTTLAALAATPSASASTTRLWNIVRRFFDNAAEVIGESNPAVVDKLRRASPHWMRHTHASHSLARGAELTSVRDNLRHASLSTTSIYLHGDEVKRARQLREAFSDRS